MSAANKGLEFGPAPQAGRPERPGEHPAQHPAQHMAHHTAWGLGLDAGGSQTRWALSSAQGELLAEGRMAGFSGLDLLDERRRATLRSTLADLACQVHALASPCALHAGMTGLADDPAATLQMRQLCAQALALPVAAVHCVSDIDIACRSAFEPGAGYLLYAGTGAIAAYLDEAGQLHRVGGRGAILGDEGGGYWIARQALAAVWRHEDQAPGSWQQSALACALFERLGGSDWYRTRAFVYGAGRGAMGQMALAVAAVAEHDAQARALLLAAGGELARLVMTLVRRFGRRPMVAAGRVLQLHPLVEQGLREALPPGLELRVRALQPEHWAARRAAQQGL